MEIERIVQLLEARDLAKQADLVGVSDSEIAQLERRFGIRFPSAYTQFLRSFGRSAGFLSTWMAIYFDDLLEIREEFDLLNSEPLAMELPANALLISHLDGVFDYIFCDGSEDPEVYRIHLHPEKGAFCEKYAASFSAYLEKLILLADSEQGFNDALEDTAYAEDLGLTDDEI